jgi:hypothetical protein
MPRAVPGNVSIVGRNINCRNKNGLFSRHNLLPALETVSSVLVDVEST